MLTNDMQPTNTGCRLRHKANDTAFKKYFIMGESTHITTPRADKLRDLCLMARAISATIAALAIILSCSSHKSGGHISGSKYPEVAKAKAMMQTARQQAAEGNTAKSIATYESCAMLSAADESADDSLVAIISDATVQIVNAYQTIGKPEECVRRLQAMLAQPHTTLHRKCRRDAMVCLAYAMSRTEAMTEAANAMDRALRIPPYAPSHTRLFRDYSYAAATYFCVKGREDDVEKYGRLAIEEATMGHNTSGVQWTSSLLGMMYKRSGDMGKALDMYDQSYDIAHKLNDSLAMANACDDIGELLMSWNLSAKADTYSTRALKLIKGHERINPMVTSNILANKARTCEANGLPDSALHYLKVSELYCKALPYNSGRSDIDLVRGRILSKSASPQRRTEGMDMLKRAAHDATPYISAKAYYHLAKAYLAHGERALGEQALDSMYEKATNGDSPRYIDGAYEYALDHYLATNDLLKIRQYAQAINTKDRRISYKTTLHNISSTVIKLDNENNVKALAMKEAELQRRATIIIAIAIACVLTLVLSIIIMNNRRKMYNMTRQLMEEKLLKVTTDLKNAECDKQEFMRRLSGMGGPAITAAVSHDIKNLCSEDGETKFRKYFCATYPGFMPALHSRVPSISNKEELLCMLIMLGKNKHEIGDIFCIAESSVNMARYRLRQKMQLTRSESLDACIKDIAQSDAAAIHPTSQQQ